MKYLWSNQNGIKNNLTMEIGGDFIGRQYHIKVLDNLQHESPKKVKRFRSAFTTDQVNYLEKQFKKFPYIGNAHRKEVAAALSIPERAVKIWFQNRRMKEKKESTTKELDDKQGVRKSLEFKNQLNNVTVSSANEQPRSLPILTHLNQKKCNNNIGSITSTCDETKNMVQGVEIKDSSEKLDSAPTQNVKTTAKVIHPPSVFVKTSGSPPDFESSINLCKKYKTESFTKPFCDRMMYKKETEGLKMEEPKFVPLTEQMIPEDLSTSRKLNMPAMGQPVLGNTSSNTGFVSLLPTVAPFYTQPYISASGVIWKPVSVMPVVSTSSSLVPAPTNPLLNMSPVQENFAKRSCNCDCHLKHVMSQVPYNFSQQSPSPQYIITTVPFQNPSTKF